MFGECEAEARVTAGDEHRLVTDLAQDTLLPLAGAGHPHLQLQRGLEEGEGEHPRHEAAHPPGPGVDQQGEEPGRRGRGHQAQQHALANRKGALRSRDQPPPIRAHLPAVQVQAELEVHGDQPQQSGVEQAGVYCPESQLSAVKSLGGGGEIRARRIYCQVQTCHLSQIPDPSFVRSINSVITY